MAVLAIFAARNMALLFWRGGTEGICKLTGRGRGVAFGGSFGVSALVDVGATPFRAVVVRGPAVLGVAEGGRAGVGVLVTVGLRTEDGGLTSDVRRTDCTEDGREDSCVDDEVRDRDGVRVPGAGVRTGTRR